MAMISHITIDGDDHTDALLGEIDVMPRSSSGGTVRDVRDAATVDLYLEVQFGTPLARFVMRLEAERRSSRRTLRVTGRRGQSIVSTHFGLRRAPAQQRDGLRVVLSAAPDRSQEELFTDRSEPS